MAFFTVQRNEFTKVSDMMKQVVIDMSDHGFEIVSPTDFDPAAPLTAPYKVVLNATTDVDPLASTQPWRICFDVMSDQTCAAFVATPFQISDTGEISGFVNATGQVVSLTGIVGSPVDAVDQDDPSTGFINRSKRVMTQNKGTFPLNYRLSISDHGFFLGAWEGNWASVIAQTTIDSYMNWILVQRPVNKQTGATLVTGKCPLFCVNKVNDGYWRFIVRESDIPHPTVPVVADEHTEDNFRLINSQNQVSITEDKKYLVSFVNNLNTPRFRYTEELDMIGIISADVVMESIPLTLSAYGANRIYTALPGDQDFNTGVRVLALTSLS
jgi:hypothetical protein